MVFVISCQFLPILVTSFDIAAENILHFSVFSPRYLNSSPLNSLFAGSFIIKQ